jgi:hypothetical protein
VARGLAEIERAHPNFQLLFFNTVGCPPIPSYTYTFGNNPNCPSANRLALEKIATLKPDTVIVAANWAQYDGGPRSQLVDQRSVVETVDRLKSIGVKRVVGVGQFPVWDYAVPKLLARQYRDGHASLVAAAATEPIRGKSYVDPTSIAADELARQWFAAAGAEFISPISTLCNDAGCLMTVPGHIEPMERDEDHLTNAGSVWFVANNQQDLGRSK